MNLLKHRPVQAPGRPQPARANEDLQHGQGDLPAVHPPEAQQPTPRRTSSKPGRKTELRP